MRARGFGFALRCAAFTALRADSRRAAPARFPARNAPRAKIRIKIGSILVL
jgi:hypothetical protein